jgi:uncharacterized protein (DUF697 family)
MSLALFGQIKHALQHLNPADVRAAAQRTVHIRLIASSAQVYAQMEAFLAPAHLSQAARVEALRAVSRADTGSTLQPDIVLYEASLLGPKNAFAFDVDAPADCVRRVLKDRTDLALPLARQFSPFRKKACHNLLRSIAKENALFCVATALPDVIPSLFSIPWAVGAYGSDAIFLTVNQIRMAFLLAAAYGRPVGYREQRKEIASIIASSFGWRALARELVGKIPLGGGVVSKAAVAWAGTFALGLSMEKLYRVGAAFTSEERDAVYKDAFKHGRQVAGLLWNQATSNQAKRRS